MNATKQSSSPLQRLKRGARFLLDAYTLRFARELLYVLACSLVGALIAGLYYALAYGLFFAVLTLVGIPCLYLGVMTSRPISMALRWVNAIYRQKRPRQPTYRRTPDGATIWQRVRSSVKNRQTWMDLGSTIVYGVMGSLVCTAVFFMWWGIQTMFMVTYYGYTNQPSNEYSLRGEYIVDQFGRLYYFDAVDDRQFFLLVLVAMLLVVPWIIRFLAWVAFRVTDFLLVGLLGNLEELERVKSSRAKARAATSDAYRRLERDIHDGPQQELVRLGMDLARARRHMSDSDIHAKALVTGAVERTNSILCELRDLSRGIAPPILTDRGLLAALREIAARSATPCTVTVDVPQELPYFAEETLYFICSEAMANVNKHAVAASASITVTLSTTDAGPVVVAIIRDDGKGGAHPSKGSGLAGLMQRAEAADGTLTISSPVGGPTVIETRVPCEYWPGDYQKAVVA